MNDLNNTRNTPTNGEVHNIQAPTGFVPPPLPNFHMHEVINEAFVEQMEKCKFSTTAVENEINLAEEIITQKCSKKVTKILIDQFYYPIKFMLPYFTDAQTLRKVLNDSFGFDHPYRAVINYLILLNCFSICEGISPTLITAGNYRNFCFLFQGDGDPEDNIYFLLRYPEKFSDLFLKTEDAIFALNQHTFWRKQL